MVATFNEASMAPSKIPEAHVMRRIIQFAVEREQWQRFAEDYVKGMQDGLLIPLRARGFQAAPARSGRGARKVRR